MIEKNEIIKAFTTIKEYCYEHYCNDCGIRDICDNNLSGYPANWEIPDVEGTLPIVYIKPVHGGQIPEKKTEGAAAWDCYARESVDFYNGETHLVPLGFSLAMPEGVCAFLLPRISMGLKTDLIMANSHGLIDSDYRGEVCAIYRAINLEWDFHSYLLYSDIHRGDRIAQIYFNEPIELVVVDEFPDEVKDTERGEGGFGSTGK